MSKKIRANFRKNRNAPPRKNDWLRQYEENGGSTLENEASSERIVGRGKQSKKLTVKGEALQSDASTGFNVELEVDLMLKCGLVPSKKEARRLIEQGGVEVNGAKVTDATTAYTADDLTGEVYRCQIRRLLKTLSTGQRNPVVAGDRVLFRPAPQSDINEGFIERIEPRQGVLCRTSWKKQHVIAANIDQTFIIASAAEPEIKPNLIDRIIHTAEKVNLKPIVCINKIDLVDPAAFQPLAGVYASMGLDVLFLSTKTGQGIEEFKRALAGKASVVTGQSGVGKSSLLNAVDPTLQLRTQQVSDENEKGKHTTTAARLYKINASDSVTSYVLDTPGIRSFHLWDVIPEEVAGFYRDIRPFVSQCQFDDCTHTHETGCAVKAAVGNGLIDARRYDSYCQIFAGELEEEEEENRQ